MKEVSSSKMSTMLYLCMKADENGSGLPYTFEFGDEYATTYATTYVTQMNLILLVRNENIEF